MQKARTMKLIDNLRVEHFLILPVGLEQLVDVAGRPAEKVPRV